MKIIIKKDELVRELLNEKMLKDNHSIKFNVSNFNSGVYCYKLSLNEKLYTKKGE